MPIERYRNLEDARKALWLQPGSPALAREWDALYRLSTLAPAAPPIRGLRKFRTIEAANRDTEAWTDECVRRGQQRRQVSTPSGDSQQPVCSHRLREI